MAYTVADQMIEVLIQAGVPQGLRTGRGQPQPRSPTRSAATRTSTGCTYTTRRPPRWRRRPRPSSPGSSRSAPAAAAPATRTSSRASTTRTRSSAPVLAIRLAHPVHPDRHQLLPGDPPAATCSWSAAPTASWSAARSSCPGCQRNRDADRDRPERRRGARAARGHLRRGGALPHRAQRTWSRPRRSPQPDPAKVQALADQDTTRRARLTLSSAPGCGTPAPRCWSWPARCTRRSGIRSAARSGSSTTIRTTSA